MYANMIAAAIRARSPRINDSEPSRFDQQSREEHRTGHRKFCSDVGPAVTLTEEFADRAGYKDHGAKQTRQQGAIPSLQNLHPLPRAPVASDRCGMHRASLC